MEHTPVKSSNIESVGYDEAERKLQVQFKGGDRWEYDDVPPSKHRGIIHAGSPGGYFHAEIRGKHSGTKV